MSKITKSARGEQCQLRIPNHCNSNPETVVFCHIGGGGMGRKSSDIHGSYGCSSCHDVIDHRSKSIWDNTRLQLWFFDGMVRTQLILIQKGLIDL